MPSDSALANAVCERFSLPEPSRVAPVPGGLQHRLLRVDFRGRDSLALKILAPRSVATESGVLRFERGETLASLAAQQGVPALVACKQPDGAFVGKIEGVHFLVYPWAEGGVLPPQAVSPERACKMGGFLARVHALGIRFPEQTPPVPEAFPEGHFLELSRRACEQNTEWAARLGATSDELERLNARADTAQRALREGWVTGHLDFDQKNVLWDGADEPLILDWEQAKPIHPALEAMGAGLSWAGQSAGAPSKESFVAWLKGYREQKELRLEDLERAADGVLGKWTIWLDFNLQRLLDAGLDERERQIAFDAGMHALGATLQLGHDGPMYRAWCREAFRI
ncbi:hypothetical protein IAD21_02143 [Abditibacteriota bacterium]|nr:hypothetical protein IAD21_02143 [Abditibacteriota bacterium]